MLYYTNYIVSNKPLGHQTLANTVAHLCKTAGITGFKMNHSMRAIAATRLYHSGQLVMERTGHWSLDGIRKCKWTSSEPLSDIFNSKRPCQDPKTTKTTCTCSSSGTDAVGLPSTSATASPATMGVISDKINTGKTTHEYGP